MYVRSTLESIWDRVSDGHAPPLADRGALWMASAHAGHTALEAIEKLYTEAGSTAVYRRCAIDRCVRDARTAVQHVCLQRLNYELMGRQLTGRDALASVWGMDYRGKG